MPALRAWRHVVSESVRLIAASGSCIKSIATITAKSGDDVLVVQGDSRAFNPTLDDSVIEAAERDDPESARSEWLAEFRTISPRCLMTP